MATQFKVKYSLTNGNKLTKKNWMQVYAVSSNPCTNVHGVPAIDAVKHAGGQYFERWELRYEPAKGNDDIAGYIFREVNHNCGICGKHSTPKKAIWAALHSRHISIFLPE